jgi:serine/threonine protein kinase
VAYVATELLPGGELFDFVALKAFSEPVCRFYFKQMLSAIHSVHSLGAAHRDLKPENILLDAQFNIKISDFGLVAPIEGRDGSGVLTSQVGTSNYMPPEVCEGNGYTGYNHDLFALGIILFILATGRPPFGRAD